MRHGPGDRDHRVDAALDVGGNDRRRSSIPRGKETTMAEAVTGPASYFPSIEKKYGQPMQYWFDLVAQAPVSRHMEIVNWLKTEYGMGHGHANAIVGYVKARKE